MKRRDFLKTVGLSTTLLSPAELLFADERRSLPTRGTLTSGQWPVLRYYDFEHLARVAMPLGGIGTGSVSLGGRGDLRDWEVMNRPAKGFTPVGQAGPFFALYLQLPDGQKVVRAIEGPIDLIAYEGSHGSTEPNHGLPRFKECAFATAYPLGQVRLTDPEIPVDVRLEAFNPLIPGDAEASGWPVAVMRYVLHNKTDRPVTASVCGSMPNFIGVDGWTQSRDWKGDLNPSGAKANRNQYKVGKVRGLWARSGLRRIPPVPVSEVPSDPVWRECRHLRPLPGAGWPGWNSWTCTHHPDPAWGCRLK